jgi:endoglucanase
LNAVQGISNSLSDSTTDTSATSQSSSAYLFHKVGDEVTDQTVSFLLNENTVESIVATDGTSLSLTTDYSVADGVVTITSSLLSQYLSATVEPGSKTNLTVSFSAGADATVEVVQWDVPILASTTSQAVSGSDLLIPTTWKGLSKLAAVKMLRTDGVYLFDDWTQYFGPLQQARGVSEHHTMIDFTICS